MNVSLKELYEGKATIIKEKSYLSTKEYVEPFINMMKSYTDDFRIQVRLPDQITKGKDKDLTYNRVLIEAVLPQDNTIDNHDEVIGFLYGLDIRKPIAKLYRGYLNRACTNLSVFDPQWLKVQELEPDTELNYKIDDLLEMQNGFKLNLQAMKKETIAIEDLHERLGYWMDYCLTESYDNGHQTIKLSHTVPIKAYKSLFLSNDSKYYVGPDVEPTVFQVHEAMTQIITDDTDILGRFEKTIMINKMMKLL